MWRCAGVILFAVSATAMAAEPKPEEPQPAEPKPVQAFRVSQACLESAKAGVQDYTGHSVPVVYIKLDEAGGELLNDFTMSRVGQRMQLLDGNGQPLMEAAPIIQSPLNRTLMLTGFDSRGEAEAVAKRLEGSDGPCGPL